MNDKITDDMADDLKTHMDTHFSLYTSHHDADGTASLKFAHNDIRSLWEEHLGAYSFDDATNEVIKNVSDERELELWCTLSDHGYHKWDLRTSWTIIDNPDQVMKYVKNQLAKNTNKKFSELSFAMEQQPHNSDEPTPYDIASMKIESSFITDGYIRQRRQLDNAVQAIRSLQLEKNYLKSTLSEEDQLSHNESWEEEEMVIGMMMEELEGEFKKDDAA